MNTLLVAVVASLAVLSAASPSGHGTLVSGPSGIVTDHGPIGPTGPAGTSLGLGLGTIGHGGVGIGHGGVGIGHGGVGIGLGLGLGGHGGARATLVAPSASAVISGPAIGHGIGLGLGGVGLGLGGAGLGGVGLGLGHGIGLGGVGLGLGHGIGLGHGVITNGGGTIGIGHGGVAVRGPGTVPATIAGPAGKIVADGLWGPTLAHGHGGHGW